MEYSTAAHPPQLLIDRERYQVTVNGRSVSLTYKEFATLLRLAEAGGRVVTYDTLAASLWKQTDASTRRRLSVTISRLRAKLGTETQFIDTVRPVGYRLSRYAEGSLQS